MSEKQTGLGDELFGTPMGVAGGMQASKLPAGPELEERDLDRIQVESEGQALSNVPGCGVGEAG